MKRSRPNKLNTQIYSEASDWLVEFRSGDADATGRKEFYHWLRTSPEHMRAYLELAAIWNEGSRLDPDHRFDDEDLIQQARTEANVAPLAELEVPHSSSSSEATDRNQTVRSSAQPAGRVRISVENLRVRFGARFLAIAASALVAIFGVRAYSERNTYSTAIGEQRSLALADGSTVELNAHSKIRVRFAADRRTVELLQGQALFYVAKDRTRPFVVESGGAEVRAVGTEFDVYRRTSGTTVTVIEGRVAVLPPLATQEAPPAHGMAASQLPDQNQTARASASRNPIHVRGEGGIRPPGGDGPPQATRGGGSAEALPGENPGSARGETSPSNGPVANAGEFLLGAGEQVILTAQATVKQKQPDIAAATAWTHRRLVFQSATLTEVAEEFNRYNARQLVINDPELAGFHITGVFASTDPGSLIRFLQARPGIMVTEKNGEILVTRKPW
jgi:transmembrane sensor